MRKILFENKKNIISRVLKQQRLAKGLTQEQVAAKMQVLGAGIDQQMISKIESNNRIVTDYEFACLCVVLQIQPHELLADFYETYQD